MTDKNPLGRYAVLAFGLLLVTASVHAALPIPAPPNVPGSGHLLIDAHSGRVLAEANADTRLEPASLTKIMTSYVVFRELRSGNLKVDDQVLISEKAWKAPGSRMFVEVGKRVPVIDLLKGMIIQSGNDASIALAEHVAGSEDAFASLMNEHAKRLGLKDTHFANATGLPHESHYTTPRDISRLAATLIAEFPELYRLYSEKEFTWNNITQKNRNLLLWRDATVDGVKTGHTKTAGYCLVASALRGNMRLVSAVMGTDSERARADATQALLNYGFRFFETHPLYRAGKSLTSARIWKGERELVALGLAQDLFVTIPRQQYDQLQAKTEIRPLIEAPVAKGERLGKVVVELNGELVAEAPLIALQDIGEGGIFHNLFDTVLMWFENAQ